MNEHSTEVIRWYRVKATRLVTPAPLGASWMLELRDSAGKSIEALWIVNDLPEQRIPKEGSWGLFRLACFDMGLALTANYVTALLATLAG